VAIKICSSMDVMKHELSMMRLVQGCPVVSQLVAPQVFGGGIVMSVYEEVSRQNFSFTQACHDLRQAIEHLHRLDICHNDIKPDSIMFDPRSRRFVLIDFSNAQFRDTLVAYVDQKG
jgi:serine/threonine protein kinase